jgi:hypothetical protein
MRTSIKFAALAGLPANAQLPSLAQAIDWELKKPQLLMDMLGSKAPQFSGQLKSLDGRSLDAPSEAQFKAFLAQKYATTIDNPILSDISAQFASFFHTNMPEIDTGWTPLFDLVDLRGSTHDHFDIVDTSGGVTYDQIKPGAEIKKRTKLSEAKTTVSLLTMGAGLGILDDWIQRQQFWNVDEAVNEFRAKHFDKMAELHYGLFTALSTAIDVAFTVDDPTTFNAAAAALFRAVRFSGYATGQNAGLYILTSPEKVGRVTRMIVADRGSGLVQFGTVKEPIAYSVRGVIASTFVTAADTGYYLILPNRKIKRAIFSDLAVETDRNPSMRATDWYAHAQYNAAIGDTAQVRRVKFA